MPPRVLLVDLNAFSRYPTLGVGYLTAILREGSIDVDVFSPLTTGISGVVREAKVRPWDLWLDKAKYWSGTSHNENVRRARNWLANTSLHAPSLQRETDQVADDITAALDRQPYDAVLVSTYLMYHELVGRIGAVCESRRVPLLVGGPYFAQPEVRAEWIDIPGVTGLVGGEVEFDLCDIVHTMIDGKSLGSYEGVWTDDPLKPSAKPLHNLDAIPFPDFSDFPWSTYPNRIVPITTGRGCSWGACLFCGDVQGTIGRRYRSRSPENVLAEMTYQSDRFGADLFVFTDPKLNSNLDVWDALLGELPGRLPTARWIGAVHVDTNARNGLSRDELRSARRAGMVRMTTGLESGSQRILDLMRKGVDMEQSAATLDNAAAEDISVRVTMVAGYPGERVEDVIATADFLQEHSDAIERVAFNRFHIITGTKIHRLLATEPESFPDVISQTPNHRMALVDHNSAAVNREHRRAMAQVLRAAHQINRRPIRSSAQAFEGVM